MPANLRDPNAVFLNVPFDSKYEKQFLALIAAIIAVGRTPRSVLEIAETGIGRLTRLLEIISECQVSVHDLVGDHLKRHSHPRTLFSRTNFLDLVAAGVEFGGELGQITP